MDRNCRTGEILAGEQVQAARKEDVLDALGIAGSRLRGKLGESLSSVQKFDMPLEKATTPSLDALKAYSTGLKIRGAKGDAASIPFFKHAIELDPNFALAFGGLSSAYQDLGINIFRFSRPICVARFTWPCTAGQKRLRNSRSSWEHLAES